MFCFNRMKICLWPAIVSRDLSSSLSFGDTETFFMRLQQKKIVSIAWIFSPVSHGCLVHETNLHVRGSKMAVVLVCFDLYKRIWLVKNKNVAKILLKVRGHEGFYVSTFETLKFCCGNKKQFKSIWIFCLFQQQKLLGKKVANSSNLTWGHTETFSCDCNKSYFCFNRMKICFRVSEALGC